MLSAPGMSLIQSTLPLVKDPANSDWSGHIEDLVWQSLCLPFNTKKKP